MRTDTVTESCSFQLTFGNIQEPVTEVLPHSSLYDAQSAEIHKGFPRHTVSYIRLEV